MVLNHHGYYTMETREIMTFFTVAVLLGLTVAKSVWPKYGFKFNCGHDICTFPVQYCDTSSEQCKYCNSDLCNTDEIPQQCQKACSGDAIITFTSRVYYPFTMSPKRGGQDEQSARGQWTVSLGETIIIMICATILIIVIITVVCYCKLKTKLPHLNKQQTTQGVKRNGEYHQIRDDEETTVMSVGTKSNQSGSTDSGLGNLSNVNNNSASVVSDNKNGISPNPPLKPTAPQKDTEEFTTKSTQDNLRDIHAQPQTTECGKDERQFDAALLPENGDTTSPGHSTDRSLPEQIELLEEPNGDSSEHGPIRPQETTSHPVEIGTSSQHKPYQQSEFTNARQVLPRPGKHIGKANSKDSGLCDSSEETLVKNSIEKTKQ